MMRTAALVSVAVALLYALYGFAATDFVGRPDVDGYLDQLALQQGFSRDELNNLFKDAQRKQPILDAIARPAEKSKPWSEYREIFLTDARIAQGVEFWRANAAVLARAQQEYAVPAEIIVAIIGVETRYGRNAGTFRVLDALATLAFDYPPRSDFFRGELTQFLLLAREEGVDPRSLMGSYAGAMGYGQFIPSELPHLRGGLRRRRQAQHLDESARRDRQRRELFQASRLDRRWPRRRTRVDQLGRGRTPSPTRA